MTTEANYPPPLQPVRPGRTIVVAGKSLILPAGVQPPTPVQRLGLGSRPMPRVKVAAPPSLSPAPTLTFQERFKAVSRQFPRLSRAKRREMARSKK